MVDQENLMIKKVCVPFNTYVIRVPSRSENMFNISKIRKKDYYACALINLILVLVWSLGKQFDLAFLFFMSFILFLINGFQLNQNPPNLYLKLLKYVIGFIVFIFLIYIALKAF